MKAIPLANHLTESELEDRIRSARDASIRDKYRAFLWILQGEKRREISKRLGVSRISIQNWVKRYNSEGESGLPRKSGQGRKRTISPDKVERIKEWVRKGGGVWTLKRMRLKLAETEGISVSHQAIWFRLKESKWSWKTGRPTNPEGNKEAQAAFKKGG